MKLLKKMMEAEPAGQGPQAEEQMTGTSLARLVYQLRRRVATVLAIAIAGLLAYHVMFGRNGLSVYEQKRTEDRQLQKEILSLKQENAHLTEHVQHLETDPDTIEHEARMILHYARPGEIIYKFNDQPSPNTK